MQGPMPQWRTKEARARKSAARVIGDVSTRAIIGVAITVVVALALLPVITDFTTDPNLRANLTSTQITLLDLIPTFYIIGVVVGVVVAALVLART